MPRTNIDTGPLGRTSESFRYEGGTDQRIVDAYCPNTSRLIGLLEGTPAVLMSSNSDTERPTDFTVRCIKDNGVWVGIEAARANEWFEQYLLDADRNSFRGWTDWKREVDLSGSQIDFVNSAESGYPNHWVEVKSLSSRASDGRAFYSGTPSRRAYRQLYHLSEAVAEGDKADVVFIVQRPDVRGLAPADETDEEWISNLRDACDRGGGIRAFRCTRKYDKWSVDREIPQEL